MEEISPPMPPGGGEDESAAAESHPLQNPVVLERLFQLIPFQLKDFRNFRLVSRAWHALSLSSWRQNAKLALLDEEPQDDKGNLKVVKISRRKYLELMGNNLFQLNQHPFQRYSLKDWEIDLHSVNQDGGEDQINFWNRVGPIMTHLVLETCKFAGVADLRFVIFEVTSNLQSLSLFKNVYTTGRLATRTRRLDPNLPQHVLIPPEEVHNKLVELKIDLLVVEEYDYSDFYSDSENEDEGSSIQIGYFPITWIELFIHFPNIKKMGPLHLGFQTGKAELWEFFKSLEILRKKHGPRYLADFHDLDFDYQPVDGRLISSIHRLQFPLQRLTLQTHANVKEKTFRLLFQSHLEYLKVERDYYPYHDG